MAGVGGASGGESTRASEGKAGGLPRSDREEKGAPSGHLEKGKEKEERHRVDLIETMERYRTEMGVYLDQGGWPGLVLVSSSVTHDVNEGKLLNGILGSSLASGPMILVLTSVGEVWSVPHGPSTAILPGLLAQAVVSAAVCPGALDPDTGAGAVAGAGTGAGAGPPGTGSAGRGPKRPGLASALVLSAPVRYESDGERQDWETFALWIRNPLEVGARFQGERCPHVLIKTSSPDSAWFHPPTIRSPSWPFYVHRYGRQCPYHLCSHFSAKEWLSYMLPLDSARAEAPGSRSGHASGTGIGTGTGSTTLILPHPRLPPTERAVALARAAEFRVVARARWIHRQSESANAGTIADKVDPWLRERMRSAESWWEERRRAQPSGMRPFQGEMGRTEDADPLAGEILSALDYCVWLFSDLGHAIRDARPDGRATRLAALRHTITHVVPTVFVPEEKRSGEISEWLSQNEAGRGALFEIALECRMGRWMPGWGAVPWTSWIHGLATELTCAAAHCGRVDWMAMIFYCLRLIPDSLPITAGHPCFLTQKLCVHFEAGGDPLPGAAADVLWATACERLETTFLAGPTRMAHVPPAPFLPAPFPPSAPVPMFGGPHALHPGVPVAAALPASAPPPFFAVDRPTSAAPRSTDDSPWVPFTHDPSVPGTSLSTETVEQSRVAAHDARLWTGECNPTIASTEEQGSPEDECEVKQSPVVPTVFEEDTAAPFVVAGSDRTPTRTHDRRKRRKGSPSGDGRVGVESVSPIAASDLRSVGANAANTAPPPSASQDRKGRQEKPPEALPTRVLLQWLLGCVVVALVAWLLMSPLFLSGSTAVPLTAATSAPVVIAGPAAVPVGGIVGVGVGMRQ
jgi:hypothetical protein